MHHSAKRSPSTVSRLVALAAALAACSGGGATDGPTNPGPAGPVPVASVAVSLGSSSLYVGQTTTATAAPRDSMGAPLSGRSVTWSSTNGAVAAVSSAGQVTALAAGSAAIVATSEGRSGSASLTVVVVAVASLTLSSDSMDLTIRAGTTLQATPRDSVGQPLTGRLVTWQSSDAPTASVNSNGMVTMLMPGAVTITASCEGRTASARVRGTVADLSAIMDSIRLATGMPAMGAAIVSRQGLVGIGVGGFRRITGGARATINDKWHIGSNTKAVTGLLAGLAVDAGVLTWGRTVQQAFPDLAATTRVEFQSVTLRELLSHTSGVVNSTVGLTGSSDLPAARTAWAGATLQQAPAVPRGTYYYSNSGYGVAGSMIERAWGSSYENLVITRILQPLGITGAGWGPTTGAGGTDQPVGHYLSNGVWVVCEACDNLPGLSSAGTMHITLPGWARLVEELLRADQGRSGFLSQSTAQLLTSNAVPPGGGALYGIGWGIGNQNAGSRWVAHAGSNTLNHSNATLYLDAGMALLVTINAADLAGGTSGAAIAIAETRLNRFLNQGR